MNISEAIRHRKSTRAFLTKEVEQDKIVRILETARHAPSGANTQPWQVAVVSGQQKKELQERMIAAFDKGEQETKDYHYYPENGPYPIAGDAPVAECSSIRRWESNVRTESGAGCNGSPITGPLTLR